MGAGEDVLTPLPTIAAGARHRPRPQSHVTEQPAPPSLPDWITRPVLPLQFRTPTPSEMEAEWPDTIPPWTSSLPHSPRRRRPIPRSPSPPAPPLQPPPDWPRQGLHPALQPAVPAMERTMAWLESLPAPKLRRRAVVRCCGCGVTVAVVVPREEVDRWLVECAGCGHYLGACVETNGAMYARPGEGCRDVADE